jgi:hypothetical protein
VGPKNSEAEWARVSQYVIVTVQGWLCVEVDPSQLGKLSGAAIGDSVKITLRTP